MVALSQNAVIRYRIYEVRDEAFVEKFMESVLPKYLEASREIAMCFEVFQDRNDPLIFVTFEIFADQ